MGVGHGWNWLKIRAGLSLRYILSAQQTNLLTGRTDWLVLSKCFYIQCWFSAHDVCHFGGKKQQITAFTFHFRVRIGRYLQEYLSLFIYLFIFILFNDTVRSSDYAPPNERMDE